MTPQPTSKDLAERLARKCAIEFISWAKDDKHPLAAKLEQIILTQTALPELLECAEALRSIHPPQDCPWCTDDEPCAECMTLASLEGRFAAALTALDAKLKEVGVV